MFIHSGTLKRAGILAAVVAVGTAAAITYNAFLSSEGGLPEVLSPLQPIIKDEDGGVKQKTDIAFSPDGSFFDFRALRSTMTALQDFSPTRLP